MLVVRRWVYINRGKDTPNANLPHKAFYVDSNTATLRDSMSRESWSEVRVGQQLWSAVQVWTYRKFHGPRGPSP